MRRIGTAALGAVAFGLLSCGGGSSEPDAFIDEDAEPENCNPISNTGCNPTEKCTFVVEQTDPIVGHIDCQPDGNVGLGGVCLRDAETGVDDCEGGLLCTDGVCNELCTAAPDSCPTDQTCIHQVGIFSDSNLGMCEPPCDLFAQDCADEETCYLLLERDGYPTVCFETVPEPEPESGGCGDGAAPATQDQCCSFVNTCEPGYGCVQPPRPDQLTGHECAYFCDPTGTTGGPTDCTAPGPGPAPDFECIPVNKFFSDVEGLPDSVGFCITTAEWGPASCWNGEQDGNEADVDCCPPATPSCPCVFTC